MIHSLQTVQSFAESPDTVAVGMKPMGSRAIPRSDEPALWQGQTTWAWQENEHLCAVGWDWIEMLPGVLVMADPMSVLSNVEFVTQAGIAPDTTMGKLLVLNMLINRLPWQKDAMTSIPDHERRTRLSRKSANQAYAKLLAA
jgi:hypothetical protein